ncbi:MAG: cyanophycinase [Thermoanaerobaculia bacterium]|nr:cyanophycinase [Thermoanaerobaculia bacterium]
MFASRFAGFALALLVLPGSVHATGSAAGSPADGSASRVAAGAPKGHLVLNGGGGEAEPFWPRIFELAGGKGAAIVILPTASERAETGTEYVEELRALGATGMRAIELRTREDASSPEFLAAIAAAKVIFFTGGDQSKITAAILGTPAEAAIRKVYDDGGVLAGSSAGLACMSRVMLTGEGDFTVLRGGNVEVKEGLGYVTEAILDQHFVARQRQNRLISVVLEHPELPGIGVDEKTSIWIRPDRTFEVMGDGWVMIFDARKSAVRKSGEGNRKLAADEMVTRILVSGDRFDLKSGTILPRL